MKKQSLPLTLSYQKLLFALLTAITFFIVSLPFASKSFADSTTLAWDANSEGDLAGYKIYYSTNSAEGPFNGTGLAQGASPISVGLSTLETPTSPSFLLSGLAAGESYYFAVSAYNESGIESDYSNTVRYDAPTPVTYSLTASATGQGSISPTGTLSVLEESSKAFTINAAPNHHIVDIIVDGTSVGPVNAFSFENISAPHSIQAIFEIDSFPIIASSSDNGTISSEGVKNADFGTSQTYTITPAENHHIADVIVDGTSVGQINAYSFENISAPHSIQAIFEIDSFPIIASSSDNGTISSEGQTIADFGSSRTYTITPAENHHIVDVIVNGVSMGSISTYTFDQICTSHSIEAIFEIDTFSITTSAKGNGTITPGGSLDVICGSNQVCKVTPDAGHQISDVRVDGKSVGAVTEYTFLNIAKNHLIEASFVEIITEFSMEIGEVSVGSNWQQVSFNRTFIRPVVVASSLSTNDDDPAVVRIDNVTSTGFEISVQEWDYLDDNHLNETIGYIVMEAGRFTLPDGTVVEAGTCITNDKLSYVNTPLTGNFTQIPVVVASVSSYNGPDAVTIRLKNISTNNFTYQVQEQEANTDGHPSETVSYIAWEPCRTAVDGVTIEVAKTEDIMTHDDKTITFHKPFAAQPIFLASMQTRDGSDLASLRWDNRNVTDIQVKVEEDQSKDTEMWHTPEVVGYFAFSGKPVFDLWVSKSPDRSNPVPLNGQTVSGDIYIFTGPDENVASVEFFLNGTPYHVEKHAPFDFNGTAKDVTAFAFDTTTMLDGKQQISALIRFSDGSIVSEILGTFQVYNTSYALWVSTSSDRSNPVPLNGQTVSGDVYIFTGQDKNVASVSFFLNGTSHHVENHAPFDFDGTARDGSAVASDTTTMRDGRQQISASIKLMDGNLLPEIIADFSVNNTTIRKSAN